MSDTGDHPAGDTLSHCPREQTGLPRPRKRHWRIVLLMLIVFIAGGAVGSAVTIIVVIDRLHDMARHPEEMPRRITARISEKLGLTDEQAKQVQDILEQRQHDMTDLHEALRAQIAAVLTDEQQAGWEEMCRQFDQRRGPHRRGEPRDGRFHERGHHDRRSPAEPDESAPGDAHEDQQPPAEPEPATQ